MMDGPLSKPTVREISIRYSTVLVSRIAAIAADLVSISAARQSANSDGSPPELAHQLS